MATIVNASLADVFDNRYGENVLNKNLTFYKEFSATVVDGTGIANASSDYTFSNGRSLFVNNLSNADTLVISGGGTTWESEISSYRANNSCVFQFSIYNSSGIPITGRFRLFSVSLEIYTIEFEVTDTSTFQTFFQNINLPSGDFDIIFELDSDVVNFNECYVSGIKLEYDQNQTYIPTIYSPPVSLLLDNPLGWASYVDTTYVVGAPFAIAEGATSTLPNNSGTVIDDYLPTGVVKFYDQATSKLTPQNVGDFYSFSIRFKAKNSNLAGYFDFGIDIGGSLGIIFKETQLFLKGANTEQSFSITCNGYSLDTFIANGGLIKIHSILGNTTIYDIQYQINRTYKA